MTLIEVLVLIPEIVIGFEAYSVPSVALLTSSRLKLSGVVSGGMVVML